MSIHRKQDNTHINFTIEQLGRYNQQKTGQSHQKISQIFCHSEGDFLLLLFLFIFFY